MWNIQNNVRQYISDYEHEMICNQNIFTLLPSNIRDIELNDIFHNSILNNMNEYLKKDLRETIDCFYYELWTATSLMCFRIIERELKTHINVDLEVEEDIMNWYRCIEILEDNNYNESFIEKLNEMRELRNLGMHGEKRFSSKDTIGLVRNAFFIVSWIYNFY